VWCRFAAWRVQGCNEVVAWQSSEGGNNGGRKENVLCVLGEEGNEVEGDV
jgi:hypothetical protein